MSFSSLPSAIPGMLLTRKEEAEGDDYYYCPGFTLHMLCGPVLSFAHY